MNAHKLDYDDKGQIRVILRSRMLPKLGPAKS